MFKRRKLLMLLILLLPVQGFASTHARMLMTAVTQAVETMPCHEQQAAHHSGQPADEGKPGAAHDTDAANHLCCHQVFYCATCGVLNSPAQKFSDVSRFMLPLPTLFIPDAPDRPPRG